MDVVPLWKFLYGVIRNPYSRYVLSFCGSQSYAKRDLGVQATSWSVLDSAKIEFESIAIKMKFTPVTIRRSSGSLDFLPLCIYIW